MTDYPMSFQDGQELYRKNVQYLPTHLKTRLERLDLEEVWKHVDVIHAKNGQPICRYKDDERRVQINSLNPTQEAQSWSYSLPFHLLGAIFMFGCGFGYPLLEMYKNMHKDCKILVFEQNIHIFVAMLHYFDLAGMLSTHKFVFFVGEFSDYSTEFQTFLMTSNVLVLTAPSVLYAPSSRIFKQDYLKLQTQIFESLVAQVFKFGNSHADSLTGFHNIIANTEVILESPYLSSLKGKFPNTPAFIVANGPSLDKNILELKNVQGKGLILCCESAIIPLMKNGIQPDAIIVAERDPESYLYHFQNYAYPKEIALLALSVADPRTFASFLGPKIPIFRSLESTSQWLNHLLGDGIGLFGGINVSHLAYETAVYLGANPIVLVGQDLAYGADGLTHSKQSKYAEAGQDYIAGIHALPVVYVEGNDGTLIPSIEPWEEFRKELERLIEQNPHLTTLNATEGGSKIRGAKPSQLSKIIEHYCQEDLPTRLSQLILEETARVEVAARKQKTADLLLELKKYVRIYQALGKLTASSKANCERLLEELEYTKIPDLEPRLNQQYAQNSRDIFTFLRSDLHNYFFLQVILHGYHKLNELGAINSAAKIREVILIQYQMFDHLNIICASLVRNFQVAIRIPHTPHLQDKHSE